MQELVREYLSNVKSRRKRRRRITITIAVFAVLVVGSVVWSLARMGIAMTGDPKCGVEEHTHSDACYTDTLVCGMEESAGHTHSDACYQTESTLVCGMEESEEHVHDESCYATSQTLYACVLCIPNGSILYVCAGINEAVLCMCMLCFSAGEGFVMACVCMSVPRAFFLSADQCL